MVELTRFELVTFCMPCKRATNCAIAPQINLTNPQSLFSLMLEDDATTGRASLSLLRPLSLKSAVKADFLTLEPAL